MRVLFLINMLIDRRSTTSFDMYRVLLIIVVIVKLFNRLLIKTIKFLSITIIRLLLTI